MLVSKRAMSKSTDFHFSGFLVSCRKICFCFMMKNKPGHEMLFVKFPLSRFFLKPFVLAILCIMSIPVPNTPQPTHIVYSNGEFFHVLQRWKNKQTGIPFFKTVCTPHKKQAHSVDCVTEFLETFFNITSILIAECTAPVHTTADMHCVL